LARPQIVNGPSWSFDTIFTPDDAIVPVITELSQKGLSAGTKFHPASGDKKDPAGMAEPDLSKPRRPGQRPNNNHNRMITGIGTPTSQSRSPFPIFASMN
jgi:hypothetical protein